MPAVVGLVGDIGSTNARFALALAEGGFAQSRVLAVDDHPGMAEAIAAYLAQIGAAPGLDAAALAVASPVTGDAVTLTNHPWSFSIAALKQRFALDRLHVINDFTANALAVPHLRPGDCQRVGGGDAAPSPADATAPIAVLGPGTGLGVSGLVPAAGAWTALAGEGGHVTMAPADDRESAVLDRMRRRFDHVSAERVLSGQGLVNLYNTLAELDGVPAAPYSPAQITDQRIGDADPLCRAAVAMFCAMLGTVAGNLALTLGARGGVYIAGGIVPRLGPRFAQSGFRERFEAKGRFRDYIRAIPSFVITNPIPAFIGLAQLLRAPDWSAGD